MFGINQLFFSIINKMKQERESYEPPQAKKELGERIRMAWKESELTQAELAEKLGVSCMSLSNYMKGLRAPDIVLAGRLAFELNICLDWLVTGNGPMHPGPGGMAGRGGWNYPVPVCVSGDDPWVNAGWQEVPVVGLANCGDSRWFSPGNMALRVSLPVDYPYNPNTFAVIAVGSSMQPEGIRQGYVLFCDPSAPIEPGDAIYIEKNDGIASVKKFLKSDADMVHVQAWADPAPDGHQDRYDELIDSDEIKRMVCVVIVKRKG
ncbi:MAG: LexA family transcriptional regulator [Desulfovibrionaceae bacterium]|nr:LexA family transcriptional regulator [Desulfovibrionaceae bacterium]